MLIIAVDGPAGAGKSTIVKKIAQAFDCVCVDTGAIYRTVGVFAARAVDAVLAAARQNRGRQIGFLDERQRAIAAQVCRSSGFYDYRFWGGYPEASRVLFGCFPDYIDPDAAGDWWELTEEQWQRVLPLFSKEAFDKRGKKGKSNRQMLNAILCKYHTRIVWLDLPEKYGEYHNERFIRSIFSN